MNVIDKLRTSTKSLHNRLDQNSDLKRLLSPNVHFKDYVLYLRLFHEIHGYIEPMLEDELSENVSFERRVDDIKEDLNKLGMPPILLKNNQDLQLSNKEALGAFYVLEGSRLGGKMIADRLEKNLTIQDHSFSFLKKRPNYSWKDTLSAIEREAKGFEKETIEGAVKTFNFIISYVHQFYAKESAQNR